MGYRSRRAVLSRIAGLAAVGTSLALAGCSAVLGGSDGPALSVSSRDVTSTEEGHLIGTVTVKNTGDERGDGTLYAAVEVYDGETYTKTESISVLAGRRDDYTFRFENVPREAIENRDYELQAWME